jgi:Na+-translocating ferredoxin:NAD+ oxidoreductase RnfD subunit
MNNLSWVPRVYGGVFLILPVLSIIELIIDFFNGMSMSGEVIIWSPFLIVGGILLIRGRLHWAIPTIFLVILGGLAAIAAFAGLALGGGGAEVMIAVLLVIVSVGLLFPFLKQDIRNAFISKNAGDQ